MPVEVQVVQEEHIPHLINERGDADGEAVALAELVDVLGVDALLQQPDGLGEGGRQDPRGVEARPVPHHDHHLALLQPHVHRRAPGGKMLSKSREN